MKLKSWIQIDFEGLVDSQKEILIATLSEHGFEGFEEGEYSLKTYIDESAFHRTIIEQIANRQNIPFTITRLEDKNWNEYWESNFNPVIIGDFVGIRAEFHPAITDVTYEIIITPKMSFGTGHHATTVLMIEQMKEFDFAGKTIMDFGTGTALLAILAEKMGARKILAIDYDDWSIENAAENVKRNQCINIELLQAGSAHSTKHYGIILANINRNVIMDNLSVLSQQLDLGGILLVSGLLKEDENEVKTAAAGFQLNHVSTVVKNRWIAIRFSR